MYQCSRFVYLSTTQGCTTKCNLWKCRGWVADTPVSLGRQQQGKQAVVGEGIVFWYPLGYQAPQRYYIPLILNGTSVDSINDSITNGQHWDLCADKSENVTFDLQLLDKNNVNVLFISVFLIVLYDCKEGENVFE